MTRATASPLLTTRYGIAAPAPGNALVARSLALYGEWAERETDLLSGLVTDGHHVVEIGGDHGAHTLWLARAVGDSGAVHAFEPSRLGFQQLCANVALNQLPNVHAHQAWAGRAKHGIEADGAPVRCLAIDDLALPALHLLKVNLANALVDALVSASQVIKTHAPLVYARLSGPTEAESEVAALKALDYRVWSHAPMLYNADNHAGAARNIFPGIVASNVIAASAASGVEFEGLVEV
ncbi:FkbM family methyltransferase [Bacillus sp. NP157]|nr:FkbM family methyltransferase [Bacillus sp. NP157]